jgi:hypothetical protein
MVTLMASSQQRKYANQIKPIRQNGHLLLVTLLLGNMIVNESLPVISDPILGGGVQSVIVSTVLIVMCVLQSVLYLSSLGDVNLLAGMSSAKEDRPHPDHII